MIIIFSPISSSNSIKKSAHEYFAEKNQSNWCFSV